MSNIPEVRVASLEPVASQLNRILERNQSLGTPPSVAAVTWQIAGQCFNQDWALAGIVQEYNLGVALAHLEIAEGIQSRQSERVLSRFLSELSAVNPKMAQCDLRDRNQLRNACLYVTSNVNLVSRSKMDEANPFRQDNISSTICFLELSRHILAAINICHPLNSEDPFTQEKIPDEIPVNPEDPDSGLKPNPDLLITPTGNRFSLSNLLKYHNSRVTDPSHIVGGDYLRLGEDIQNRFLVNPLTNTAFPWCDVQSILIATARSENIPPLNRLHREAIVPGGAASVIAWSSLQEFYQWVEINQQMHSTLAALGAPVRADIYTLIDKRMINKEVENQARMLAKSLDFSVDTLFSLPPKDRADFIDVKRLEQELRVAIVAHLRHLPNPFAEQVPLALQAHQEGGSESL